MDVTPRTYIDSSTGEAFDLVALPRSQARSYHSGRFFMGMLQAFSDIADSQDLTDMDRTVLMKLMGRLDWENFIHINVTDLAKELGRSRESVSRSISRLCKAQVLYRGPRVSNSSTFRLSPKTGWRGPSDSRRRVQRELDERGWQVITGDDEGQQALF